MKKFLMIILLITTLTACNNSYVVKNDATGTGIPKYVSHIEFWNGGTKIGEYDNAYINILLETRNKFVGLDKDDAKTTFITYEIKYDGIKEYIIDSEALAIKFIK